MIIVIFESVHLVSHKEPFKKQDKKGFAVYGLSNPAFVEIKQSDPIENIK